MLYFYREAARLCQEQSAYDFSALVVGVVLHLAVCVRDRKGCEPTRCKERWPAVLRGSLWPGFRVHVCPFSDACLLSSLKMVSYTNLCLRSFAYTTLVVSRCYSRPQQGWPSRGIASNIMIFAFICPEKHRRGIGVLCLPRAHGLLLLNFAQTEGKPVEEVQDSGKSSKTPPP